MTPEDRSSSAQSAEDRRLLLRWLQEAGEEKGGPLLADLLAQLEKHRKNLSPLIRFLRSKESEERARRALVDRENWHRSLSWRFVSLLFSLGAAGMVVFVVWGAEQAFTAASYFFLGCMAYYLAAQLLIALRIRRNRKAWQEIQQTFKEELDALRAEHGRHF